MVREAVAAKGGVAYFERMADEQPAAFLALVGKCLPRDVGLSATGAIVLRWIGEGD